METNSHKTSPQAIEKRRTGIHKVTSIDNGIVDRKGSDATFMSRMPGSINRIYYDLKAYKDKIQNYKKLKEKFRRRMKYELNMDHPRSYNEKIQWKKINDRNPLLTVTADKYAVRSYIKEALGEELASKTLIPLYHVTDNPEDIPFDSLPEKFVVKPNHGSQMHLIVKDKKNISPDQIVQECKKWLKVQYGLYGHEWAYRNIKKNIIVEKLLETSDGSLPLDYKFYCFNGKCKVIRVTKNRFGNEINAGYFDTQWNLLNAGLPGYNSYNMFDKPSNIADIIDLAEKLSQPFDYVRVDLYNVDSRIYFGELTHYEASGFGRFEPEDFDFKLGEYWTLEPYYWRKFEMNQDYQ